MEIEIIAIGNEVLSGFTTNSNAAFISQTLFQTGFRVDRHTVLPDDASLLMNYLQDAINRCDLVITTGGLGPTCDDLTRQIAAELFESSWHYSEEVAKDLKERFGENLPTIKDQATVPSQAIVLKNRVGTAPGFIFEKNGHLLVLLPGVPAEMKAVFVNALPIILEKLKHQQHTYSKHLNLFLLYESQVDPFLRQISSEFPDIEFGIYPSQTMVMVLLTTKAVDQVSAEKKLNKAYEKIAEKFKEHLFEGPFGKIEWAVHQKFTKSKMTLSLAESCTGGQIASRLTLIPGASTYFLGSVVAYSNDLKTKLLNVPEELIQEKGAVSKDVVSAMCHSILEKTGSDCAAAVTGIAGPSGGSPEKPVGTIWCAVKQRNKAILIWKMQGFGSRDMIIDQTVNTILAKLLCL